MATRFYLPSTGNAAVTPTPSAGWEDISGYVSRRCVTTKIGSAMTTFSFVDADETSKDCLLLQYVSDPITAQTIGTSPATITMRCKERATSCNMNMSVYIAVVSGDGTTVRGVIHAQSRGTSEFSALALVDRFRTPAVTSVDALEGDRIVIEIGGGGDPGAGSDHDFDMSFGDDSSTDLTADGTDADADNPWIEFPDTITFVSAGGSTKISKMMLMGVG